MKQTSQNPQVGAKVVTRSQAKAVAGSKYDLDTAGYFYLDFSGATSISCILPLLARAGGGKVIGGRSATSLLDYQRDNFAAPVNDQFRWRLMNIERSRGICCGCCAAEFVGKSNRLRAHNTLQGYLIA